MRLIVLRQLLAHLRHQAAAHSRHQARCHARAPSSTCLSRCVTLCPGTVGGHAREQAGEGTQEGAGSCSPVSTHVSRQGRRQRRGQGKTHLPLTQVRGCGAPSPAYSREWTPVSKTLPPPVSPPLPAHVRDTQPCLDPVPRTCVSRGTPAQVRGTVRQQLLKHD